MDRRGIKLAVKLLAKAESTDSDPESAALALRSCSLLERSISTLRDSPAATPSERRDARERRAARSEPGAGRPRKATRPPARGSSVDAVALAYSRFDGSGPPAPGVGIAL